MHTTHAPAGTRLTVLHTSDWQCGRPFVPRAAEALVRLAASVEPDVVVVSGDLTQRAKAREFRAAVSLLGRLPDVPTITTPGNHDVPLYRVWERLADPFRNWRRFVSEELDSVTSVPGGTFVALGSAAPRRAIVNGRLTEAQVDRAERAFAEAPAGDVRCLVVHHHFVPTPDGGGGPPLPEAPRWLARIETMGADCVLGGHVHRMHVRTSRDVLTDGEGPGVPIVACGTTTSRRGRGPEAGWNSLTVTRFAPDEVRVTPYRLAPEASEFREDETLRLARPGVGGARGAVADTGDR